MKILIVRLDHLGDLVLTTPLIRALARAHHDVDLLVPRIFAPLFEDNPHRRECHVIEEVCPGFPRTWFQLGTWMRTQAYDAILLPQSKPRELLWSSLFSGAKIRLAMQAGVVGRLTLHRCLPIGPAFRARRPFADLQLDMARALEVPTDGTHLDFFPTPLEIAIVEKRLNETLGDGTETPLVGIHPGCAGNTCNLPSSVYGELAELILARSKSRIVVTGSQSERILTDDWPENVRNSKRVWLSQGHLDLRSLGALISRLSAYVIPSTGPLHLASALRIRTVSPFCPRAGLSAEVWGNRGGPGAAIEPPLAHCEAWEASAPGSTHCHFRGEITAEMLWSRLETILAQSS